MKKAILIINYERDKIFYQTLNNILNIVKKENYKIIVVHQDGSKKSKRKLLKYKQKVKLIFTSYPKNWHPFKKNAYNYIKGSRFCFENLKCDICHFIEDDLILSKDFFKFSEHVLDKYRHDKKFFAFNAFSKQTYDKSNINLYSKFIYGIGKGWSLNKNKWNIVKKLWNKKFLNIKHPAVDGPIETYIKKYKNFVVMPICSRVYEIPSNGLNLKKKTDKNYLISLKQSFVRENYKKEDYKYTFFTDYKWRKDCIKYKGYHFHAFLSFLKKVYVNYFKI